MTTPNDFIKKLNAALSPRDGDTAQVAQAKMKLSDALSDYMEGNSRIVVLNDEKLEIPVTASDVLKCAEQLLALEKRGAPIHYLLAGLRTALNPIPENSIPVTGHPRGK